MDNISIIKSPPKDITSIKSKPDLIDFSEDIYKLNLNIVNSLTKGDKIIFEYKMIGNDTSKEISKELTEFIGKPITFVGLESDGTLIFSELYNKYCLLLNKENITSYPETIVKTDFKYLRNILLIGSSFEYENNKFYLVDKTNDGKFVAYNTDTMGVSTFTEEKFSDIFNIDYLSEVEKSYRDIFMGEKLKNVPKAGDVIKCNLEGNIYDGKILGYCTKGSVTNPYYLVESGDIFLTISHNDLVSLHGIEIDSLKNEKVALETFVNRSPVKFDLNITSIEAQYMVNNLKKFEEMIGEFEIMYKEFYLNDEWIKFDITNGNKNIFEEHFSIFEISIKSGNKEALLNYLDANSEDIFLEHLAEDYISGDRDDINTIYVYLENLIKFSYFPRDDLFLSWVSDGDGLDLVLTEQRIGNNEYCFTIKYFEYLNETSDKERVILELKGIRNDVIRQIENIEKHTIII